MSALPESCALCPRACGADRAHGQAGVCGAADELRVARAALHAWEEPPISVGVGSGAVFFSHCPMRCIYCQNAGIAQGRHGTDISVARLAEIFSELAAQGAANINLVTPTHYLPHIEEAADAARARGLGLPFVYNTSGYETIEAVRRASRFVDVWLTDFKYAPSGMSDAAARYSNAPDYFEAADAALAEMVRAAGTARFDEFAGQPRLVSGVVVRHLLLPGRLGDSMYVLEHLWREYGNDILYSVMSQYTPMRSFPEAPELSVRVPGEDYERLLDYLDAMGMPDYYWQQGGAAEESFIPAFDGTGV